jgi:hypothetical protein
VRLLTTSHDGKIHRRPTATSRWTARLQAAGTVDELVAVVQSYLATCEKSEIDLLSRMGAPTECTTSDDLQMMAIRIATARAAIGPDSEGYGHVTRLFALLTDATSRLGHLELESNREWLGNRGNPLAGRA